MKKSIRTLLYFLAVALVVVFAFGLRIHAANTLPIDYDEDDYLRAGQEFAHLMRNSDWRGFLDTNYRISHPPLTKIFIGLSILSAPEKPLIPDVPSSADPNKYLPGDLVRPARRLNTIFGTLTVVLLATVNPLAGLFLAVHTFTIKYVSQIMLEAFPALTSFLTALAYLQWKKGNEIGFNGWLFLSGLFLGLTAASKYLYCVVGIAILVDWYLDTGKNGSFKVFLRNTAIWALLAFIFFFVFDPYLWPDPIGRLKQSVFFHAGYANGAVEVQNAAYPVWQPFFWLFFSPYWWQEGVFPFPFDLFITIFALAGLNRLWKRERLYVLWLGVALIFLLFWPTKWPQYVVALTVPLSMAAAEGAAGTWQEFLAWWRRPKSAGVYKKSDTRRALPWLVPGFIAFILLTLIPLIFEFGISMTDFNAASLRDGFKGGIRRAIFEGITGQQPVKDFDLEARPKEVNFTGLNSYSPVLNYIMSRGILFFNVLWTVLSVLLQCGLGLAVALLLWQRGVRFAKFWQALFILPWAIPELIGAQMWLNIFIKDWGWLYLAATKFGSSSFFAIFAHSLDISPSLWLIIFLLPAMWYGFPFMMLVASAGLKMIPPDVFDAAAMDGAGAWQTFRLVTLPLLMPLLIPALIVRGIFAFNQFYLFQTYYYQDATLATLSYNIFNPNSGYSNVPGGQFAISAVINIITVIILMIFVVLFNRWSKAGEGVTYA
jgi:ABC-type sugar transport system permease subunit